MTEPSTINRRGILAAAGTLAASAPALNFAATVKRQLDWPRADDFSPHVGSHFRLEDESGHTTTAELVEVSPCSVEPGPGFRKPFSVVFRVPSDRRLQQNTYRVSHRSLGSMKLLLAPVSPPGGTLLFEAVFG